MALNPNRKTSIPIKSIPLIIEGILRVCTLEELLFMNQLAESRRNFGLFSSILTRLTDMRVYEVFYLKGQPTPEQLMNVWIGNRAEVAGLKAFQMACQAASAEIKRRRDLAKDKKRGEGDV